MEKLTSFDIYEDNYLDPSGHLSQPLPDCFQSVKDLVPLYKTMVLNRLFDTKAIALQRTGQMGTYPSSLGQEASAVGLGSQMIDSDILVPCYREHGTMLMRGVLMEEIMLYWGGDERGMDYKGPKEDFPVSVPIATHLGHSIGVATAVKLRKQKKAVVTICGDGATSKGDFYEAINFAGVWRLPIVFVVMNNQWAISVPLNRQTATKCLAQKSIAAGIPGIQVDGNDIVAVAKASKDAIENAREGGGATLIEMMTYRMGDHTTADDGSRYRSEQELHENREKDPIQRLKKFLMQEKAWTQEDESSLAQDCQVKIEASVKNYLGMGTQPVSSMFDYMYANMPEDLQMQRAEAMAIAGEQENG